MAFYARRLSLILCRRSKALSDGRRFLCSSSSSISQGFIHTHEFRLYRPTAHIGRDFSSKTDLKHVEGPVALDYSSVLKEEEFHKLSDEFLQNLQERLEAYGDDLQIDGFDLDYASGVLTVKLGDLGTYVINKQTPNRQIWLSSPMSGPARFDWDREKQAWIYRRTKANLLTLMETELSDLLHTSVTLST